MQNKHTHTTLISSLYSVVGKRVNYKKLHETYREWPIMAYCQYGPREAPKRSPLSRFDLDRLGRNDKKLYAVSVWAVLAQQISCSLNTSSMQAFSGLSVFIPNPAGVA